MSTNYVPVEGLFAFWRYDLYPYLLGAPITHMNSEGRIKAEGYDGCSFTPIKIVTLAAGHAIRSQLKELDARATKQRKDLEKQLQAELDAFFAQYHIPTSR